MIQKVTLIQVFNPLFQFKVLQYDILDFGAYIYLRGNTDHNNQINGLIIINIYNQYHI